MTGCIDALRGDGLVRAQRALAGLEGDPLRLDRARQRFSHSPPSYTSNPSGDMTCSPSPISPGEERRQERRGQLALERYASRPEHQLEYQIKEEEERIFRAHLRRIHPIPTGSDAYTIACGIVKKRWVEQGIWNSKWDQFAYGRWKHEEPLEPESESETETETHSEPAPPLIFSSSKPQPKPRRVKSDEEKRRIAEARVIREREREASRPYHQFLYQISRERERIQKESADAEGPDAADINTVAYENVKNAWTKQRTWISKWGVLPGMSWKHEGSFEEQAAESPAPVPANRAMNGSHEAGEAPFKRIFGPPSPVETDLHQASGALYPSQQGPPADIDSTGLDIGDADPSSSIPNLSSPDPSRRALRPPTGKASLRSKRKASHKDEQLAHGSLNQVNSSKVSKTARRKAPQQRLNISHTVSYDGLPLSSGVDVAEPQPSSPPDRVTPRRSKRLQPPISSAAKESAKTASTDPSKRAVRSKPARKLASKPTTRSSAKPQGVSKRQPTKATRGEAKKK